MLWLRMSGLARLKRSYCKSATAPIESGRKRKRARETWSQARSLSVKWNDSSAADFGADDVTEKFPLAGFKAHHLRLLDRSEVAGRGIDLDARQQRVGRKILQASGLFHYVVPGKIVAALLEHLHHGLRGGIAERNVAVGDVCAGHVFVDEDHQLLHAGIVLPL